MTEPTAFTLRNDMHRSEVTLTTYPGHELTRRQIAYARRILCGCEGCACGGNLGERGPQSVAIDVLGHDELGHLRIQLAVAS